MQFTPELGSNSDLTRVPSWTTLVQRALSPQPDTSVNCSMGLTRCIVCIYALAVTGTHCCYPLKDGQAELTLIWRVITSDAYTCDKLRYIWSLKLSTYLLVKSTVGVWCPVPVYYENLASCWSQVCRVCLKNMFQDNHNVSLFPLVINAACSRLFHLLMDFAGWCSPGV